MFRFPGLFLNIPSLFHPLSDYQLFSDTHFWEVPESDDVFDDGKAQEAAQEDFQGIELRKEAKKNQVDPETAQGLV